MEVTRNDPNSPLHSVKRFEQLGLPEALLKGLYDMGFAAPSKIQETALPILLATPTLNLVAQSQSGTGKTAAFILGSLYRVDTSKPYPQVLILSPTYELARQTGSVAERMAKFRPDIRFKYAIRETSVVRGAKLSEHVIIGTPGKTMDWALKFKVFDIKKIQVFVLDEADIMIDTQGLQVQCMQIKKQLSSDCQIVFFSATYDDEVMRFAENIVPHPVVIRLRREEEALDTIKQYFVSCGNDQSKYSALANLFGTISMGQAFIFVATKACANWLSGKLKKDGHAVGLISGELTVEERLKVLQEFRDGKQRVLIATNVMARGIDVEQVTVVVNYDLPIDVQTGDIDYETYLHRIGRTGRFGKHGLAINFVDSPTTLSMIKKLEDYFKVKIESLDATNIEAIERINVD